MREIKFRACNKKPAKMSTGKFAMTSSCESETEEVVFLQWTGLKDVDGRKIYEGDIIRSYPTKSHKDSGGLHLVWWNEWDAKWDLCERESYRRNPTDQRFYNGLSFDWGGWWKHKIIGNIYENPELLDAA